MILEFSDIYGKISEFLALGSSPTGDDLTLVKNLSYRGYRRFLFPVDPETKTFYKWSFLHKTAYLQTENGEWRYNLPTDYVSLISAFKFVNGEDKDNPEQRSVAQIISMRGESTETGTPSYFSIRPLTYSVSVGSNYEVLFWETPDSSYDYSYIYYFSPDKPEEDTDVFVGGPLASEVILQCGIAAAELQEDEIAGVQEAKAIDMLNSLIAHDKASNLVYDPNL